MGGSLDHAVGPAHGSGADPLLGRPLPRVAGAHHQVFLVQAALLVAVGHQHRVGDRGPQRLLDVPGHRFLREAEDAEGVGGLLAPDRVQHEPGLLGRGPDVAARGAGFECRHLRLPSSWPAAGAGAAVAPRGARRLGHLLDLRGVALELARGRELAELVPDHVLGHVHGDELLAVVDGQGVAHHLGGDGRAAGPGLDDLALPAAFIASTFFIRWSSTNGPFFSDLAMATSAS